MLVMPSPSSCKSIARSLVWVLVFLGPAARAGTDASKPLSPPNVEKADQLRRDLREMITLARDRVFPALVNIRVITVWYAEGKDRKGQAVGSGTIISKDGHVLTNYHVVENGKKFKCTLADKQEISAELVGEDPLTDLAVLKLDLSELKDTKMEMPVAKFGDSDELEIGDTVMAMGSPWALSRSVSLGIVANTERMLSASDDEAEEMRFDEDQRTGIFNRWIQHDASISPGNSGGPLVNLKGELVGVNARGMFFGGDMAFAIPSNVARSVAEQLIEHREVPRSWLGLSLKPIKKSGHKDGVLINSIDKGGPAEKAGLQAGDVITAVNGEAVTVWFPEEVPPLLKKLADQPIASSVRLSYRRDETKADAVIVTDKLKKDKGDEAAFRAWGMAVMGITDNMARERRLDSTDGVLVQSVRSGSPAEVAEPPILPGDILRAIDGKPVKDLPALLALFEQITKQEKLPEYLLIGFDRRGTSQLTLLKPKPDKDPDPTREVPKAWLGVAVQPVVAKLATQLGKPDGLGFRVTRVYPRTLAAHSELKVGDIIVALGDEKLKPKGMQDAGLFQRQVRKFDINNEAALTILRDGQERKLTVKLEPTRMTQEEARRDRNRDFEIVVREVTFFDRDENRWDESTTGVLVDRVEPAGWAQLGGVQPGDLVQRIDDRNISGLDAYRAALEDITKRQPKRVVFVVLRGVRTHFQYIEPDWNPGDQAKDDTDKKEK